MSRQAFWAENIMIPQPPRGKMGTIGLFIAHEISHCFDDIGNRYDKGGNLKNWWIAEDQVVFENRTAKAAD